MNLEIVSLGDGFQAVIIDDDGNEIDRVAPCPTRISAVVAGVQIYPFADLGDFEDASDLMDVAMWASLAPSEREHASPRLAHVVELKPATRRGGNSVSRK